PAARLRSGPAARHLPPARARARLAVGHARAQRAPRARLAVAHPGGAQPRRGPRDGARARALRALLLHGRARRRAPPRGLGRSGRGSPPRALRARGARSARGERRALDLSALRPRHGGRAGDGGRHGRARCPPFALAARLPGVLRFHLRALLVARPRGAWAGGSGPVPARPRALDGRRRAEAPRRALSAPRVRGGHLPARPGMAYGPELHGLPTPQGYARIPPRPPPDERRALLQSPASRGSRAHLPGPRVPRGRARRLPGGRVRRGEIAQTVSRGGFYITVEQL